MTMSKISGSHPLSVIPLDFELDIGTVADIDFDPMIVDYSTRSFKSLQSSARGKHDEIKTDPLNPDQFISIQGTPHGQALFVGRNRVPLPEKWTNPDFPFVRSLPNGNILISDTGFALANGNNTWILSKTGEVCAHFGIGSAAVDVFGLLGGMLAVAYHPISAKRFGHRIEPQQRTAIAFFDSNGRLISSYNHEASRQHIWADNVRCMTRISPVELLFAPEKCTSQGDEVENPIILYNCASKESIVFSTPYMAPEAISMHQTRGGIPWILLASPDGFEDQVIAFDPVRKISHYLGAFVGIFRGLAVPSQHRYGQVIQGRTQMSYGHEIHPSMDFSNDQICGGFLAQEFAAGYDWISPSDGELEVHETTDQAKHRIEDELESALHHDANPDLN